MGFGLTLNTFKLWHLVKVKVTENEGKKQVQALKKAGWTQEEAEKILFWVGINQNRFM